MESLCCQRGISFLRAADPPVLAALVPPLNNYNYYQHSLQVEFMDISFMFKFNNNCFFPFFLMVSFILQLSGVFCDTNHSLAVLQYFFPVFRPGVSSIPHSSVRAGSCLSVLFSRV